MPIQSPKSVHNILAAIIAWLMFIILGGAHALAKSEDKQGEKPIAGKIYNTQSGIAYFYLKNGLQVVIIPDTRAPVVTHMIWYKAGAADEDRGKSGVAHFLEHLMFKGTKTVPAGEFSAKVAEIGGLENAFTSSDFTAFYQKVSPDALEMVMGYEADRMENLTLSEKDIETERQVVIEERSSRVDNSPGGVASEFVEASLFQHHPYGIPIVGYLPEIKALTKRDILDYYERYYTPNNAILVIAGDVTVEKVKQLAAKTYAKIPVRAHPGDRKRVVEPEPKIEKHLKYRDKRINAPGWRRHYLVPSYRTAAGNDALALDVLAVILGGSSTSRLHRALVIDNPVATSVQSGYRGGAYDMTRLSIYGRPRSEVDIVSMEHKIDDVLQKVLQEGVDEEEVEKSRNALIQSAIFSRDSQTSMARIVGATLAMGGSVEDVTQWADRLKKISVEDVNRVAKQYLKSKRAVTVYMLPEKNPS